MDLFKVVSVINEFLWGWVLIISLLGTGVYYTFKLKFVQLTQISRAFKVVFKKNGKKEKGLSSFQALSTAVAGQVGTGNLAGVATAIAAGGPGAIFWMWVSSFLGMATIFAEAVLAQKYREERNGEYLGGPAYYLDKGVGSKKLAILFAIFIILALGFIGNMVQSNSIAAGFKDLLPIPSIYIGIIVALFVGFVLFGGIKRIASFAEKTVPIMAILYIIGSIILLFQFKHEIIPVFEMIFKSAFQLEAAGGGVLGATIKEAIRYGVARGLFSNEAGMGSTPHAHATANVRHPAEQGLVAILGVLIDTIIICTVTALVILVSGAYQTGETGVALTQQSFIASFGTAGQIFIAICLLFFAFTTILGWAYFGELNIKYLWKDKGVVPYRVIVLLFIVIGSAIHQVDLVWELADFFNGLMIIPNLIALWYLRKTVHQSLLEYRKLY
ncbi:alanine/glycine:cation symporter family protein [Bacillus sp. FJAT-42315]|uniref:alanine/glycine:cation symporter family protein n=1 Tax=Bacillus sp. FJAT-42315 TaxID=2014077 RepID=UPI000C24DCFF|nr:sodium:alanine symporter family protein [Bacillus sp. FJAT-42315]